jgi:FkbM family methyltransferase
LQKILKPADIPWGARYWLLGPDDELAATFGGMMAYFRNDLECVGTGVVPGDLPEAVMLLICHAEWPSLLAVLSPAQRSRAWLFPIPTADPFGFFGNYQSYLRQTVHVVPGSDFSWFKRDLIDYYRTATWLLDGGISFRCFPCLSECQLPEWVIPGLAYADAVQAIGAALADTESRWVWKDLFSVPQEEAFQSYCRRVPAQLQYFDLCHPEPGAVVLNVGVHTGNEFGILAALLEGQGAVHCFDPIGYDHLCAYARTACASHSGLFILNRIAVGDFCGITSLPVCSPDGQAIGALPNVVTPHARHYVEAPATTLDAYVREKSLTRVDFIKMDIEGGELGALAGLGETIQIHRPQLAVSIYHSSMDFVLVPLLMMSLCQGYKFHVRTYSPNCSETIFYAIPG